MKSLTKFYLIAFCLSLLLGNCEPKPDDDVIVTYQHLANSPSWSLKGGGENQPNVMWHIYMLRGIVNKGKDAKPFVFDLKKLATNTGDFVDFSSNAMLKAAPLTLPSDFKVTVNPQVKPLGTPYTVPLGNGVLFFIKQPNDTEQTAVTHLFYKSVALDAKSGIEEGVIMHMLDAKQPVMFGHLDEAFLEEIFAKQNKYENAYDSAGNKK